MRILNARFRTVPGIKTQVFCSAIRQKGMRTIVAHKKANGIAVIFALVIGISLLPVPTYAVNSSDIAYLAFTSDVHYSGATDPQKSSLVMLQSWLSHVTEQIGKPLRQMGFCGDYSLVNFSEEQYWARSQQVMDLVAQSDAVLGNGFFVSGNHEYEQGHLDTTANAAALTIHRTGETEVGDCYILYSFGAESTDMKNGFSQSSVDALQTYLETAPTDKPIFILSHFPLHSFLSGSTNRTSPNARDVIRILNEASKTHTILFLWGHNHSHTDPMYQNVISSGCGNRTIVIDAKTNETATLDFTYAAAGAMCNPNTFSYGGKIRARGVVAAIRKDTGEITLCYFDEAGQPFYEITAYRAGEIAVSCMQKTLTVAFEPPDADSAMFMAVFYDNRGKMLEVSPLLHRAGETQPVVFETKTAFSSWCIIILDAKDYVPIVHRKASVFSFE